MYRSKRPDLARVQVRSGAQPLALTLLDDARQTVLRGYGELAGEVPVGLYWLELRSGAQTDRRILRVPPDGVVQEVALPVRTAAPLPGSADDDPEQRAAVLRLAEACGDALSPGQAGVVVFLRGPDAAERVQLHHPDGGEAQLFWASGAGYVGAWAAVPPGAWWLRTWGDDGSHPAIDLGVWLSPRRLHLWFAPSDDGAPRCAAASWHTTRAGGDWLVDPGHPEIRLHAEQALAALRRGDTAVSSSIVRTLRRYKQIDPTLGILAGALRVQEATERWRSDPDRAVAALDDVRFVVSRIHGLVPDHPDVAALQHVEASLAERLGQAPGLPAASPLTTPPMLAMLYGAVLSLDRPAGRTIVPGSIASLVAGEQVAQGPWTAWNALQRAGAAPDIRQTRARVDDWVQLADRFGVDDAAAPEVVARGTGLTADVATEVLRGPRRAAMAAPEDPTFDAAAVRALVASESVDDATVDAFLAWAEAHPDAWQDLAREALADDAVVDKAAPAPVDADTHLTAVRAQMGVRDLTGPLFAPTTLRGIRSALVDARDNGRRLRAVGSLRSLSDVTLPPADSDHFVVALSRLDGVEPVPDHHEVYVQAGCRIGNLNEALDAAGLALPNMGSGDFQTIAGLLSSGSHGSAWGIGDVSALVLALELATLDEHGDPVLLRLVRPGETVHHPGYTGDDLPVVVDDDPELFHAAVVSLGCLGLITAVTLRVQPTFFLREDRILATWDQLTDTFATQARDTRHYEVLFTPYDGAPSPALVTLRTEVDGPNAVVRAPGLELAARAIGRKTARRRLDAALRDPTKVPRQAKQAVTCSQVTNYRRKSFRVLKLGLQVDATATEIAVPVSRALDAATDLRDLVQARFARWSGGDPMRFWRDHAVPTSPISMRLAARSEGLLSMQHAPSDQLDGEPWCMFEVPVLRDASRDPATDAAYGAYVEGTAALLEAIETLLRDRYGGRPHWGLELTATDAHLEQVWGEAWTTWKQVRQRLDPRGIFASRLTDRLGLT